MYLDEQDELRPGADKKSGGMSRSALLGGGAALLVIIVIGLVAALGGDDVDDHVDQITATPLVAPRSQGQLAAPTPPIPSPTAPTPPPTAPPVVAAAPAPTPSPAPAPSSADPSIAPTQHHDSRRVARPEESGPSEEDLLQRLTDRAGAFAQPTPAAPAPEAEPANDVVAPTPEFEEPPPPPVPVPELSDEPPP